MIGTHGAKMLALTAQHADAYNTAWHGRPGERFGKVREQLHAALAKADRDPATLRLTVGMMLRPDGAEADAPGVPCEADAIADALHAWESEGVDEVVVWAYKCSNDRARRAAEGVVRYRSR
jgi:alkanesulfonate monooxygenase SsuD/methylene tetrahydromethanopterin reductase-like flavin-dependent oxidoreductase (luciferase family)